MTLPRHPGGDRLDAFRAWLERFGDAHEARDAAAVSAGFAPGATFQPGPFAPSVVGRPSIREYWSSVFAAQRDVSFAAEVLGVGAVHAIAHWSATFTTPDGRRSASDGILIAAFDASGRCTSLRQWWHDDLVRAEA